MLYKESIRTVALGLNPLIEEFVFVGGAIIDCYSTTDGAEQARPTDDIDVVVELAHYGKYASLQERLIQAGFNPDVGSKVICRYKFKGITVDIMPANPDILGFSNRWYTDGIKHSINFSIDESLDIKIFSPPLFLASKIETYWQRGARDKRLSTDFEDIIYILENRKEMYDEVKKSDTSVKEYITTFIKTLLGEKDTDEALRAVTGYSPLPKRIDHIKNVLQNITQIS